MIFCIEDDDNIRKLVCYALEKEGYQVKGFSDATLFWQELKQQVPKLILMDIMMPGEDGLTTLQKLKQNLLYEDIPVVMVTAKDSEYDKVCGLDAGADDYIAKPFGMTELISRIRAILRRYEKTNKSQKKIYQIHSLYVEPEKYIVKVSGKEIALSYKEFLLLQVLLEAGGKVVRREELLTRVWGEFYEESRTLDVHIRKLRVKLGEAGELIQTIKNVGYKLGEKE